MEGGPHGIIGKANPGKSGGSTVFLVVLAVIAVILVGLFSFTSPPSGSGAPGDVDKYGRPVRDPDADK